jgi:hypothetical protein
VREPKIILPPGTNLKDLEDLAVIDQQGRTGFIVYVSDVTKYPGCEYPINVIFDDDDQRVNFTADGYCQHYGKHMFITLENNTEHGNPITIQPQPISEETLSRILDWLHQNRGMNKLQALDYLSK